MNILLRRIFAAFIFAGMLIVLLTLTAHAQSWNSAVTSGLTSVTWMFAEGEYTWTLFNNSSLPGDTCREYDILIWELIPFQVEEPLSWVAPEGWIWNGNKFKVADSSKKYFTPCAIGPGQSAVFKYKPKPNGKLINNNGPQPVGLAFVTHVAAVASGSGALDGSRPWIPKFTQHGSTWFDESNLAAVPEPAGLGILAFYVGAFTLYSLYWRNRLG
ncbi:MAG: hypothetical protein K6T99_11120 [Armatimonadetes bacterium]|nr:hypothetical protein [Armatimonadota bacterium]